MKRVKLPLWLQHFVAVMGGGGIFLVAFLDSSVLSFPFITDALVMRLCMERPARTLYYAAMATLGSLLGCIWIYWIAKKGGEAYFHRHGGRAALKAKRWVDDHAFLSLFIPAILPPPMQFKVFVLAEGVFQVPLRTFVLALVLGRGVRYVAEGLFAVKYGQQAFDFLIAHAVTFTLGVIIVMTLMYLANKFLLHTAPATDSD
jgi:membrane protein YqaA with SNARE-associated domain